MKVLFVIKALNGPGGGAERVCVEVANGLKQHDVDIEILSFEKTGVSFYSLNLGIKRHNLGIIGPVESISINALRKIVLATRSLLVTRKPDIVVAFMHSAYVPVALAALRTGVPVLLSEHTEARHYDTRPAQRFLKGVAERCAVARTVPCEAVASEYRRVGYPETHVVHNPVTLPLVRQVERDRNTARRVILSVGVLRPEKNHIALVNAFALISHQYPQWRLRLVGDGPKFDEIMTTARRLGVFNQMEMPGVSKDIAREMEAAAFTVLPSNYEAFGLVAAESLAAARPVVGVRDCAGIAEIVEHERTGLLVQRGRSKDELHQNLGQAMKLLIDDPVLRKRFGSNGPASVERFGLPLVTREWLRLLRRHARKG